MVEGGVRRAGWRSGGRALVLVALAWVAASPVMAADSAPELPPLTVPSTTVPPLVTLPPVTVPVAPEVPLPAPGGTVVLPPLTVPTLPPVTLAPAPPAASPPTTSPAGAPAGTLSREGADPSGAGLPAPTVGAAGAEATGEPASEGPLPTRLHRAAAATARQLGFPMALTLALLAFLVVQHRLDAGDPRVGGAASGDDELLSFS